MVNLIVQVSKYLLLFLMVLFTADTFLVLKRRGGAARRRIMRSQVGLMTAFNLVSYLVMFVQKLDPMLLYIMVGVLVYLILTQNLYKLFYKKSSRILLNTMCMLISIGMVIQTRLGEKTAVKQLIIIGISTLICFAVPVFIRRVRWVSRLYWAYGILGILLLTGVFLFGRLTLGANLSLTIGGISFQFSEFVKITVVLFMAGMLQERRDFRRVAAVTVVAAAHVGILVLSTDLGAALIYFVAYIVMVFVATRNPSYALLGLGGMAAASVLAHRLFRHVRVRVDVWRDPFADYEGTGYQIVQALFAVCAGGWFGTGLFQGAPDQIPLAYEDFTFAAICEEFGVLFAVCLILLCMGMYLLIVGIAMELDRPFYKLVALGLGTEYAFQVFLTVGGTTKFIPMTGLTLPLVSYGGSSIMCTIIMISIIQGLYIMRRDEDLEEVYQRTVYRDRPVSRGRRPEIGYDQDYDPPRRYPGGAEGMTDELGKKIEKQTEESINY